MNMATYVLSDSAVQAASVRGYDDIDLLEMEGECGLILAQELVIYEGVRFREKSILTLCNRHKVSVAHTIAACGHIFVDYDILRMADATGWTVAHEMARNGYIFTSENVIRLTTSKGVLVGHVMDLYPSKVA